ncbi:MAG TPA: serine hydrolase domain-containing protein [Caulobacteraceae bacterium]|jgi:CubicO group peptidase (beta-lactamase class C family)
MQIGRRGLLGAAGLALAAGAASAQGREAPVDTDVTDRRKHAEAMRRIADYAQRHVREYGLPGMTLAVVDSEGFTGFIRVGWADLDRRERVGPAHLFQIGSISKSFVALTCNQLAQEGKLDLDAPVRRYVPEAPLPAKPVVTVRQLLNHVSGLPADAPAFPEHGKLWLGYEPGSRWSYSNTGYYLLGKVIERVEGRPLGQVTQRRVLTPLGMTAAVPVITSADRPRYATGYSPLYEDRPFPRAGRLVTADWINSDDAAGCISATAADMARYVRYLIDLSRGQGAPLLSDARARTYLDQASEAPGWAAKARYGNGLAIIDAEGRKLLQHTGGMVAFSSSMTIDPEAGVGIFASSNIGLTGYRPREVTIWGCRLLAAEMAGGALPEPPETRQKVEKPGDYARVFTSRRGERVEVRAGADSLALVLPEGEARLIPYAKDSFVADHARWSRHGFTYARQAERVARVWWGSEEFLPSGSTGFTPASPRLKALEGLYENDSPWNGSTVFYARGSELWAGSERLTPLPDGVWRFGEDDWSPERVSFSAMINGQAHRATFSGTDFWRRNL